MPLVILVFFFFLRSLNCDVAFKIINKLKVNNNFKFNDDFKNNIIVGKIPK
jgi:hypothetical protein